MDLKILQSPILKFLDEEIIGNLLSTLAVETGDIIFLEQISQDRE